MYVLADLGIMWGDGFISLEVGPHVLSDFARKEALTTATMDSPASSHVLERPLASHVVGSGAIDQPIISARPLPRRLQHKLGSLLVRLPLRSLRPPSPWEVEDSLSASTGRVEEGRGEGGGGEWPAAWRDVPGVLRRAEVEAELCGNESQRSQLKECEDELEEALAGGVVVDALDGLEREEVRLVRTESKCRDEWVEREADADVTRGYERWLARENRRLRMASHRASLRQLVADLHPKPCSHPDGNHTLSPPPPPCPPLNPHSRPSAVADLSVQFDAEKRLNGGEERISRGLGGVREGGLGDLLPANSIGGEERLCALTFWPGLEERERAELLRVLTGVKRPSPPGVGEEGMAEVGVPKGCRAVLSAFKPAAVELAWRGVSATSPHHKALFCLDLWQLLGLLLRKVGGYETGGTRGEWGGGGREGGDGKGGAYADDGEGAGEEGGGYRSGGERGRIGGGRERRDVGSDLCCGQRGSACGGISLALLRPAWAWLMLHCGSDALIDSLQQAVASTPNEGWARRNELVEMLHHTRAVWPSEMGRGSACVKGRGEEVFFSVKEGEEVRSSEEEGRGEQLASEAGEALASQKEGEEVHASENEEEE
ncbi:MAG: hypothetical protein SGPRY_014679, partial [Prymnesium sp.]